MGELVEVVHGGPVAMAGWFGAADLSAARCSSPVSRDNLNKCSVVN